jgi:hypothetical protein
MRILGQLRPFCSLVIRQPTRLLMIRLLVQLALSSTVHRIHHRQTQSTSFSQLASIALQVCKCLIKIIPKVFQAYHALHPVFSRLRDQGINQILI